ncbi:rhodanese-like domain-containing protein [Rhodobacteraceae bacterium]|nr:rhodanese-like domain-containing protein [Paracoccaceae bacterium]
MTNVSRRNVLAGIGATAVAGGGYFGATGKSAAQGVLTPPQLLDAVRKGKVLLVDVRRPDEWRATGIAEGAVPIDLRRRDFVDAVVKARNSETLPVVVICARGVRSRRMTRRLSQAGVLPIIDVPEGMLGSAAGPGWIRRGLPIQSWTG